MKSPEVCTSSETLVCKERMDFGVTDARQLVTMVTVIASWILTLISLRHNNVMLIVHEMFKTVSANFFAYSIPRI